MDLARRLIDELQSREISSACKSTLPRVPVFEEEHKGNRKLSAVELLGSSDSEAVSECDFSRMQGGSSEGDESNQGSGEDMYSEEHETQSESGESSGSNYETSSSFEARKQEQKLKSRLASKGNEKRKAPATPEQSAGSSNDSNGSGSGSPSDSPDSAPAGPMKGKGKAKAKAPPKKKPSLPRQRKQACKDTPETPDWNQNPSKRTQKGRGVKLPVRVVDEEYEGSQEAGVPLVDSRPGKKRTRAGRKRKDSRRGRYSRKGMAEESRKEETKNMNDPSIAILPTKAQLAGQKGVENVIDEDPMLESEIIVPLIVN